MRIAELDPDTAPTWTALFDACGCTCFCRWWHFTGTKNEWLARAVDEPGRSRDEQVALISRRAPESHGLVALEGDLAVGWMKLSPRSTLAKLLSQGPYRSLALGRDEETWSIGCLLVHPAHRRQGIARHLISAACPWVAQRGGRAVEAYPRRAEGPIHDEEAWMGTAALFASCGFVQVAGEGPYPVMRRSIGEPVVGLADNQA